MKNYQENYLLNYRDHIIKYVISAGKDNHITLEQQHNIRGMIDEAVFDKQEDDTFNTIKEKLKVINSMLNIFIEG